MRSEAKEQSELIKWFWNEFPQFRGALYHNYNNPRNQINGAQLIALGLIKGTPDLTLAIPRDGFGALYIEMKKKGEKPRESQIKQQERLESFGNKVVNCDSFEKARDEIKKYLSL